VNSLVWLGAFSAVWLVERNAFRERVPLYLSGRSAIKALAEILPTPCRFLDIGCGLGGVISELSEIHPQGRFDGIESAPIPWLLSRIRLRKKENCQVYWGDFWSFSLQNYDVVYCFLSPAPMSRLWEKACFEMPSGSLFISNRFCPANVRVPDLTLEISDFLSRPLQIWQM